MPVTIGGSGPITGVTSINTTVTDTELGYLDGVTSALQTQINGKLTTPGAWTSWTVVGNNMGSGGGWTGAYCQIGKMITFRIKGVLGTGFDAASYWFSYVPVTPAVYDEQAIGSVHFYDTSVNSRYAGIAVCLNSAGQMVFPAANRTTADIANGGTPFTWAVGDKITISGTYEAA